METMVVAGRLPLSTPLERRLCRQAIAKGVVAVGVPSALAEARDLGYVHPMLDAPQGMEWKATRQNHWKLCYKGGWAAERWL